MNIPAVEAETEIEFRRVIVPGRGAILLASGVLGNGMALGAWMFVFRQFLKVTVTVVAGGQLKEVAATNQVRKRPW